MRPQLHDRLPCSFNGTWWGVSVVFRRHIHHNIEELVYKRGHQITLRGMNFGSLLCLTSAKRFIISA